MFIFVLVLVFMCGCSSESSPKVVNVNKQKALDLIEDGALLVDVRGIMEYNQGHIDGAINIDVQDILATTDSLVYEHANISKDTKIIVYCRSGSRSSNAASKLIELGYKN